MCLSQLQEILSPPSSPEDWLRCLILLVRWLSGTFGSKLSSSKTVEGSGRLRTRNPHSKCDGVNGSSKSSDDTYVSGQEFKVIST